MGLLPPPGKWVGEGRAVEPASDCPLQPCAIVHEVLRPSVLVRDIKVLHDILLALGQLLQVGPGQPMGAASPPAGLFPKLQAPLSLPCGRKEQRGVNPALSAGSEASGGGSSLINHGR